jgi:formate-dependent nitrite reductase membrane component NrfD
MTALTESLLLALWLARLGRSGQPLATGTLAPWVHLGVAGAGLALPSVLDVVGSQLPRPVQPVARVLASALTLFGGFVLRSVVVIGGNRSADDAGATFDLAARARGTD